MLFNSFPFIFLFLPLTLFGFYRFARLGNRPALVWLFLASLVFYAWWNPAYLVLLLTSIAFNYGVGHSIARGTGQERKSLFAIGIAGNLLLLGYYKYAAFVLGTIGIDFGADGIVLPLAISFFTFTQITFLSDCHRGKVTDFDPLHYGLFVAYFPHLIAGPIVHHGDLVPQFAKRDVGQVRWTDIASGLTLLLIGLFKKTVLADQFAAWSKIAYASINLNGAHLTAIEANLAALAYTLQIYFDYSAYCDMALGVSVMFGIRLPLNFNSPLKAASVIDFWRRWNMTLTRFLWTYVYTPLATRAARRRAARHRSLAADALLRDPAGLVALVVIPAMATMIVCGLWHGAGWTFVVFGLLHGVFIVINQVWWMIAPPRRTAPARLFRRVIGHALTLSAIVVSLVFFRAPTLSDAWSMLAGMAGCNGVRIPGDWLAALGDWAQPLAPWRYAETRAFRADFNEIAWLAIGFAIVWLLPNPYQWMARSNLYLGARVAPWRMPAKLATHLAWMPSAAWVAPLAVLGAVAIVVMGGRVNDFIYFQF